MPVSSCLFSLVHIFNSVLAKTGQDMQRCLLLSHNPPKTETNLQYFTLEYSYFVVTTATDLSSNLALLMETWASTATYFHWRSFTTLYMNAWKYRMNGSLIFEHRFVKPPVGFTKKKPNLPHRVVGLVFQTIFRPAENNAGAIFATPAIQQRSRPCIQTSLLVVGRCAGRDPGLKRCVTVRSGFHFAFGVAGGSLLECEECESF